MNCRAGRAGSQPRKSGQRCENFGSGSTHGQQHQSFRCTRRQQKVEYRRTAWKAVVSLPANCASLIPIELKPAIAAPKKPPIAKPVARETRRGASEVAEQQASACSDALCLCLLPRKIARRANALTTNCRKHATRNAALSECEAVARTRKRVAVPQEHVRDEPNFKRRVRGDCHGKRAQERGRAA